MIKKYLDNKLFAMIEEQPCCSLKGVRVVSHLNICCLRLAGNSKKIIGILNGN